MDAIHVFVGNEKARAAKRAPDGGIKESLVNKKKEDVPNDAVELYVSCSASKTNLLHFNGHILLNVHNILDDKRQSAAKFAQYIKNKKTGELSEAIVGKGRRGHTSYARHKYTTEESLCFER